MKKILIVLLCAFTLFTPRFLLAQNSDLWNIYFEFCWDWTTPWTNKLYLPTSQWKNNSVCLKFQNKSDKNITITIDYPSLTKDQLWDNVCSINNWFEQYITNVKDLKSLVIPAGATITKNLNIFFPIWIDWNIWWCVAYYIQDDANTAWWSQIKTILRQWFPMEFFVWSAESIKNEIKISDFSAKLDENKDVIITLNLTNVWNLSDSIVLKWNIKNKFWWIDKDIEIDGWIIEPWKTVTITQNIGWIWRWYGWLFDVSVQAESTPHFAFDISKSNIDPELIETKSFESDTSIVEVPRLIICTIFLGLLVLILIIKKK